MAKESRYREEFEDRYGIVLPYLQRFPFEDEDEFDYSLYYESDESETELYNDPATHQSLKKYVQQIRDSFGFDVESRAPSWFDGPFYPVFMEEKDRTMMYDYAMEAALFGIREINSETASAGKRYTFVEMKKAVTTSNYLRLLTITVKEEEVDAVKKEEVAVAEVDDTKNVGDDSVKEVVDGEEVDAVKEKVAVAEVDTDTKDVGEDSVKEVVDVVRTIQVIVYCHFKTGLELEQWRFKPTDTVAAEDA